MADNDRESDETQFLAEFDEALQPMQTRHARCPAPELLRSADSGALPPALAASVAAHAARCAACRVLREDLLLVASGGLSDVERQRIHRRVFDALPRRDRRPAARMRWWGMGAAACGALAAAVLLASILTPEHLPQMPPAPALRVAGGAPPTSALELDKAPLKLPLATMLSLRAAPEVGTIDIQEGLRLYRQDDFRRAAVRLQKVRPTASLPQLGLYLGVCYLYLGETENAERTLSETRPLVPPEIKPDVAWYLALARLRLGQTSGARDALDDLCRGRSEYAGRACAGSLELTDGRVLSR